MTNLFKHMPLRRRVALTIWVMTTLLCAAVLGFALR